MGKPGDNTPCHLLLPTAGRRLNLRRELHDLILILHLEIEYGFEPKEHYKSLVNMLVWNQPCAHGPKVHYCELVKVRQRLLTAIRHEDHIPPPHRNRQDT